MIRLLDRLRWWVFHRLADNPKVCNASTGCWAAWQDRSQITEGRWRVGPMCLADMAMNGTCWCGKLRGEGAGIGVVTARHEDGRSGGS